MITDWFIKENPQVPVPAWIFKITVNRMMGKFSLYLDDFISIRNVYIKNQPFGGIVGVGINTNSYIAFQVGDQDLVG